MKDISNKRIYLDHAAATPVDPRVAAVMEACMSKAYANPSGLHREGIEARRVVEEAKARMAKEVGAHADEIVYTSGGTESNSLAIIGVVRKAAREAKASGSVPPHVIVSRIEHPSIIEAARALERDGVAVTYLPVDQRGVVDLTAFKDALRPNTVLVSIMYANNEVGSVQPIREVAKIIRRHKKDSGSKLPFFHTDACQAVNYLDMNVAWLGVDLMTWNTSKIYGPKGAGALFVRRGVELEPTVYGGGQERGLRSGTENTPAIAGFAEAMKIAGEMREGEVARLTELRDRFTERVLSEVPGAVLNGAGAERLPNIVNFSFPGHDAEETVLRLDAAGIAISAKSACASEDAEASYVVSALYSGDEARRLARSSVRFSLGRGTTEEDVKKTIAAIKDLEVSPPSGIFGE